MGYSDLRYRNARALRGGDTVSQVLKHREVEQDEVQEVVDVVSAISQHERETATGYSRNVLSFGRARRWIEAGLRQEHVREECSLSPRRSMRA